MKDSFDSLGPIREELKDLIDDLVDDRIEDADRLRLYALLENNDEAVEFYVEYMELHGELAWKRRGAMPPVPVNQSGAETDGAGNETPDEVKSEPAEVKEDLELLKPRLAESRFWTTVMSLSVVAALVFGFMFLLRGGGEENKSVKRAVDEAMNQAGQRMDDQAMVDRMRKMESSKSADGMDGQTFGGTAGGGGGAMGGGGGMGGAMGDNGRGGSWTQGGSTQRPDYSMKIASPSDRDGPRRDGEPVGKWGNNPASNSSRPTVTGVAREPNWRDSGVPTQKPGLANASAVPTTPKVFAELQEKLEGAYQEAKKEAEQQGGGAAAAEFTALKELIAAKYGKEVVRTWQRSQLVPNRSRLKVGDKEELPLKAIQASVQIDGFRARVVLDCFYLNNRRGRLEGRFQLRLPNNASLFFFAFGESSYQMQDNTLRPQTFMTSVNTGGLKGAGPEQIMARRKNRWRSPKVARVVPKEKAAFAYRQTVRRQVDPALVEWSGADIFSARVFPLMANKLHHIVIGYDVPLTHVKDSLDYQLHLPKAPRRVVELDIAKVGNRPAQVTPKSRAFRHGSRFMYRLEDPKADVIQVSQSGLETMALGGGDEKTGTYFVTRIRPPVPDVSQASKMGSAIFMVDVSLSSRPARFNIWLKLLKRMLDNNRDSIDSFAVLFFNIESFWWQNSYVPNTAKSTEELMKFARTLSLEGATNLHRALREAVQPSWRPLTSGSGYDEPIFLLSDGAATWGKSDLYSLSKLLTTGDRKPLFAYTTGLSGTDNRALVHLTRESGGAVFSVINDSQIAKAAVAHRRQSWKINKIHVAGATEVLVAGRPTSIFPGQELTVVGRGVPPRKVELTISNGSSKKEISVPINHRFNSELAQRAYGQVAVGQLESIAEIEDKLAAAYARHFRVPGKTCSLLMLESEQDYRRFKIEPKEDAFVVKRQLAAALVKTALVELGQQIGNQKQSVIAWLEKLKRIRSVSLQMPTSLELVIKQLPESAFDVQVKPLKAKLRTMNPELKAIFTQLVQTRYRYELVQREAARRFQKHGVADALRVLSSLVENRPGDTVLARDIGYTAMKWGRGDEAYELFRRVAVARPFEPHNYHAMASCLVDMGKTDLAAIWFEVALSGKWDRRFIGFRKIAAVEYSKLLRDIISGKRTSTIRDFAAIRMKKLAPLLPIAKADLLVTITWNTDGTDVDLHVTDPAGETCFYGNRTTALGGKLLSDVRQGLGPEMFWQRNTRQGKYRIAVNYYSADRNRTSARTKVYVTIYRNWGRENEQVSRRTVSLGDTSKGLQTIQDVYVK